MSRLNESTAKSYFYPTYYLFIQAIIDIDEPSASYYGSPVGGQESPHPEEAELDLSRPANANLHKERQMLLTNTKQAPLTSPVSADNSFSASSSISADMMFIGAANTSGHNPQTNLVAQGNSYSDNEALVDTETEEDPTATVRGRQDTSQLSDMEDSIGENTLKNKTSQNKSRSFENQVVHPIGSSEIVADNISGHSEKTAKVALEEEEEEEANKVVNRRANLLMAKTKALDRQVKRVDSEIITSIEDSNEDGDDLDDEDESDNEECRSKLMNPRTDLNPEPANGSLSMQLNSSSKIEQILFDNDRNPFTGTYGVLLAGRRRKKAKT